MGLATKAIIERENMFIALQWYNECIQDIAIATTSEGVRQAKSRAKVYLNMFEEHNRELVKVMREIAGETE